MCGIVGYIGTRQAQPILLAGLKRLEYRGYDSAGIATLSANGEATQLREKGKVAELAALVTDNETEDAIGIGHTRWATHGEPSKANAHPHKSGDVYVVHNGIIENFKELKADVRDHEFVSDTDTEVLAALINSLYQRADVRLEDAVAQALKVVRGTYGIAVISRREPEKIVAAKLGSPLLIGIGADETLIASDASALVAHTDQAVYLNDGEIAICTSDGIELHDLASQPVSKKVEKIEIDLQSMQKGGFDHYLLKEINDQPDSLQATLNGRVIKETETLRLGGLNMTDDELRAVKHIFIIGCGTASYAGKLAAYYIEQITDDVMVHAETASELRYRSFNVPENSIALFVSQSGETADTLACLKEMQRRGVRCLGVVNTVGSSIAREASGGVYLHAGTEVSVASTKAFTSQVAALLLIGLVIAQAKGLDRKELTQYIIELDALPQQIRRVITAKNDELRTLAAQYKDYDHAFYLGRDMLFPVALEGALKLKETSYIHAEGQAAGELKHGSIALVDDRFFIVAFLDDNWLFEKSLSNIIEIKARGGHIITVTNSQKAIDTEAVVRIDNNAKLLTPLLFNVISQLLAYYIATARGNDVDQPRNLAKSVTVE